MENNSRSSGIYQKLSNLFLSILTKPEELHGTAEIPIEENSSRNNKSSITPNGYLGSDINIEFMHVDERGGSTRALKKNGLVLGNEKKMLPKGSEKKEESRVRFSTVIDDISGKNDQRIQELDAFKGSDARGKGVKGTIAIEEIERQSEMIKKREGNNHMKARPIRGLGSFVNINRKSDTYIQRKKEEMWRNSSFDIS